jgi:hypothetical protein
MRLHYAEDLNLLLDLYQTKIRDALKHLPTIGQIKKNHPEGWLGKQ